MGFNKTKIDIIRQKGKNKKKHGLNKTNIINKN